MPFCFRGDAVNLADVAIDTERLTLTAITAEFTTAIFEHFTPEITRFMLPAPPTSITDTEEFVRSAITALHTGEDLHLTITDRSNAEFLGLCGLHTRNLERRPELGIWLKKTAHRNGYGLEAITALKHWADKHLIYEYVIYPVDRRNTASCRIPVALGGKVIGEKKETSMGGFELDELVYAIERVPPDGA